MSQKKQLYYLMQISGGTFPSGAFSQSWGLETYVAQGKISNEAGFRDFMETYMESMLAGCEGPVLCEAYRLSQQWEEKKIDELEELSCAVRLTKESRESSLKMGKAFLRIMAEVMNDNKRAEEPVWSSRNFLPCGIWCCMRQIGYSPQGQCGCICIQQCECSGTECSKTCSAGEYAGAENTDESLSDDGENGR